MDVLGDLSRFKVGALIFIGCWCLYFLGALQPLFAFVPLLVAIPTIMILSEIIRRLVEYQLGKRTVAVGNDAVLITGCDTGFGYLLSKRLADRGYFVFAGCYIKDGAGATELREYSSQIQVLHMDVSSDASVKDARLAVEEKLSGRGLWAVVANAGVANAGPLEWTSMEEIHGIFNVNTFGVLRTVKEFLPMIRKKKGRVVVTTSMSSTAPVPFLIPYSMSKAASKALVEGLQRELCAFGIYCSAVEPAYYATKMTTSRTVEDFRKKYDLIDDAMKKDYKGFLEMCIDCFDSITAFASTEMEEPMDAFTHAVCSVRPLPYYLVDRPYNSILREIGRHNNVEVTDAVVGLTLRLALSAKKFFK